MTMSSTTPSTSSVAIVLHAHPDDEAIFTGLTVRRLADAGVRVVMVVATCGEQGAPRVTLRAGETMRTRRIRELENACRVLGVARLELLGYQDSGAHAGPYHRRSLGAARADAVADRLSRIVERHGADTVLHYDPRGIYGHVDHVQVHRAGARVVERLGLSGYEATVDADQLRRGPRHVLQGAAGDDLDVGVPVERIAVTVHGSSHELAAKFAAMSAHTSQIGPEYLDPEQFGRGYGREWFVRTGAPGPLDGLLADPIGGRLGSRVSGRTAGRGTPVAGAA
jgi:LmbE family N-acetylglucosaminyl deacetylase